MKKKYFFSLVVASLLSVTLVMGQKVTERFQVSGNCGMCKSKIEKAAKDAGATSATWNEDSKELVVSFASANSSVAQIQQKIAEVGYDNAGARATDAAYDKLHGCCKYERVAAAAVAEPACCKGGVCSKSGEKNCCKDGKCTNSSKKEDCSKDDKCAKGSGCKKSCCSKS
jgi:mercuric ion binding protein